MLKCIDFYKELETVANINGELQEYIEALLKQPEVTKADLIRIHRRCRKLDTALLMFFAAVTNSKN